jgi:beta-lactam-binding protein with PASTA domain
VLIARNDEEIQPQPVSATHVQEPDAVLAAVDSDANVMPDLRGMSAREAVRALTKLGMTPRMTGDGFVVEQSPSAGEGLGSVEACVLKLGRRPQQVGRQQQPVGGAPQ